MERIVIVGGNAAGMSAAARAKRLDRNLHITILEASAHISYGICGAPYYISGRVQEVSDLVTFTPEKFLEQRGGQVRLHAEVLNIQPGMKKLQFRGRNSGILESLDYDRLLIATGYVPDRPAISGADHPRIFTLARLEDAVAIRGLLDEGGLRQALIVGGGYIGLELCDSLHARGCQVTLIEQGRQVLGFLDGDMAESVAREVAGHGVEIRLGTGLVEILEGRTRKRLMVRITPGEIGTEFDAVLVDIGVRPNVLLAQRAGLRLGTSGGIEVSDRMESSIPGIFAAGNCAETINLVSGRPELNFLATAASKQGRTAGENLAGQVSRFAGVVGTSIMRVFDLDVGSTGLNTKRALDAGFRADSVKVSAPATAAYLPDSHNLTVKIVFDRNTSRLLGAQIIGTRDVAGRLNVLATCLMQRMTIDAIAQLDLCYAPPISHVWDPVHVAMHAARRSLSAGKS